jgi:hypothetical protein
MLLRLDLGTAYYGLPAAAFPVSALLNPY